MRNFVQPGSTVAATAPAGGITSGAGVLIGALFGIASTTATEGSAVEVALVGVFDLPKAPAAAIASGGKVSWDPVAGQVDAPGAGLVPIGAAIAAAGNGTTTIRVRLDGVSTSAAA